MFLAECSLLLSPMCLKVACVVYSEMVFCLPWLYEVLFFLLMTYLNFLVIHGLLFGYVTTLKNLLVGINLQVYTKRNVRRGSVTQFINILSSIIKTLANQGSQNMTGEKKHSHLTRTLCLSPCTRGAWKKGLYPGIR